MLVLLGADHNGFQLKQRVANWLSSQRIEFIDFGAHERIAEDDYNDYAQQIATTLLDKSAENDKVFGVLICGSANGMAIQANRFVGIRAAVCYDVTSTLEARAHSDANIACISAEHNQSDIFSLLTTFFQTAPLPDERYRRRKLKLDFAYVDQFPLPTPELF